MISLRSILFTVTILTPSIGLADMLVEGTKIETAITEMRERGYQETNLQIAPPANEELRFWTVDDGVLIASYSTTTKLITGMVFYISDDRAKSERKDISLSVIEFNPESGKMTIQMKKIQK